jgi:hypothetical protein
MSPLEANTPEIWDTFVRCDTMQLSKADEINWFFGVNKLNDSYFMPNTAAQVLHFVEAEQV